MRITTCPSRIKIVTLLTLLLIAFAVPGGCSGGDEPNPTPTPERLELSPALKTNCQPETGFGRDRFDAVGPAIGKKAFDFELKDTKGQTFLLSRLLAEKPVVMIFGSATLPTFRAQVMATEALNARYWDRVWIVHIYTIEARPTGSPSPYAGIEWLGPSGTDKAGKPIRQPAMYAERVALATQGIDGLAVTVPVLVDEMDNAVWCTYGPAPGMAYLIGLDGTIHAKQGWYDPRFMGDAIAGYLGGIDAAGSGATIPPPAATVQIIKDVQYGIGGQTALLCDLYVPQNPIATPMPAVIWIHGGSWYFGDKYPSEINDLAERGFFGMSINYRLSGEAPFPAAVEDSKCAVRWLRAHAKTYNVDPDRIGVWGGSAGGHLSMMVACADKTAGLEGTGGWEEYSSRVQAACSYYGVSDLTEQFKYYLLIKDTFNEPLQQFMGGVPRWIPDSYRLASPIKHITPDDPPLLLVHGDLDPIVSPEQSKTMHKAYQQAGLESTLVIVSGAKHNFTRLIPMSPSPTQIVQMVTDFFTKHLVDER